jgi:hypothetical protein
MALGDAPHHHDPASLRLLLVSIVIDNYPVSIALLGILLQSGMRGGVSLGMLVLFAALVPLRMSFSAHTGLAAHSRELIPVVIGIFMHISTTILFEASDAHRFSLAKLGAIVIGRALGVVSVLLHWRDRDQVVAGHGRRVNQTKRPRGCVAFSR